MGIIEVDYCSHYVQKSEPQKKREGRLARCLPNIMKPHYARYVCLSSHEAI